MISAIGHNVVILACGLAVVLAPFAAERLLRRRFNGLVPDWIGWCAALGALVLAPAAAAWLIA